MKKMNQYVLLLALVLVSSVALAQTPVFINEIHYDNNGPGTGEFVEIFAPAGTSLAGWTVEFYNGSDGRLYLPILVLFGTISDREAGKGVATFVQSTGIQNGSPDGLALIDDAGAVIQFLSYEGSFVAADGTAVGLTSADIGVSELGTTPGGQSLQLTGTGSVYEDFTWEGPSIDSPGSINPGQTALPVELTSFSIE